MEVKLTPSNDFCDENMKHYYNMYNKITIPSKFRHILFYFVSPHMGDGHTPHIRLCRAQWVGVALWQWGTQQHPFGLAMVHALRPLLVIGVYYPAMDESNCQEPTNGEGRVGGHKRFAKTIMC